MHAMSRTDISGRRATRGSSVLSLSTMEDPLSEQDRIADERDRLADERDRRADQRERDADARDFANAAHGELDVAAEVEVEDVHDDHGHGHGGLFGIDLGRRGVLQAVEVPADTTPAPPAQREALTLTQRLAAAAAARRDEPTNEEPPSQE